MVAPVQLLVGVGTHVGDHLGIVGENLATQDTGPGLAAALRPCQLLTTVEVIAVFCREENKDKESNGIKLFYQRETVCIL